MPSLRRRPLTHPAVAPQAPLDKYRIAVLPFANISADPEDEYFSDGMTEELISKLSRLHDLTVIARTSIMQYKETDKSIAEIGRELQVGTILEGSVRKAGERLWITAQLVDVASQGHLWSQDYDRTLDDVFAVQNDVAQSVADALQVTLAPSEKRQLGEQGVQNLEAYNLYVKGLYHWHKLTKENLNKAKIGETQKILIELESRAEREHVDPLSFAWLHIGLGDKEQAFAWLEKAYEEKSSWLIFLNVDRLYDPLRPDPRFTKLLGKIGLEQG
jgi:adenylate cyclase